MANDARMIELETRLAHQEKALGELGDMITAQWKHIEGLESQLQRLHSEFQKLDQGPQEPDPPPPHY